MMMGDCPSCNNPVKPGKTYCSPRCCRIYNNKLRAKNKPVVVQSELEKMTDEITMLRKENAELMKVIERASSKNGHPHCSSCGRNFPTRYALCDSCLSKKRQIVDARVRWFGLPIEPEPEVHDPEPAPDRPQEEGEECLENENQQSQ